MNGLQIKDVVKAFDGKNVLEKISASIQEGEFVSFVGPSGCGKSTLLNLIASVEEATSGEVIYNDTLVQKQDIVSYMPQQDLLLPWRSALQNIVLPLEIDGKPKKERLTEGMEALQQFGLAEYANYYPDALSGGMRQRISFLRTYLCEKPIMLLDEPFGKLDAFTKMEVHRWLLDSWHQEKQTIVMVTHDLDEAILLSDRVFIMSQRPATIVGEVKVNLPRPRTMEMLTSLELKEDKAEILGILAPYMRK
ncbi:MULTISPECIES: ABC transporter ATP-binding protein [Bacillus]|uniref:Carnitine transport ATP-binding protein OpuCA n=1 Tax=Bacillus pseudomycoides TaxID=64104 RepID=A0AAJ3RH51_9BACI|nr:ABC transporter ATP-binding protein [Bacillus pseudomycoides]EEM07096.1 ABC transporter-related protein [Bacillus pseudomycoides]KFN13562.1 ABC transporter family protein [Bacillus pseudomycoides]MBD5797704.1 nitrate ABC transporter ATP-binding protein [Bacillus pseudomycoides]MCR8859101.1 ABC transporter ATP-binding protein [Bacillus pseudomycoides]MDR4187806.1 ABC transporter ATP-binding protein [Bacillus pseudomycoides]